MPRVAPEVARRFNEDFTTQMQAVIEATRPAAEQLSRDVEQLMRNVETFISSNPWQFPTPFRIARMEAGKDVLDQLKTAARPEGASAESPWPPPLSALLGVPVVVRDDLEPGAWRFIDRDGQVLKEGTLL